MELINNSIVIYDKDDTKKTALASLDAKEFLEDGILKNVELKEGDEDHLAEDGPYLVFTWNLDTDNVETEEILWVPVKDLVDVYNGSANEDITVAVEGKTISATLNKDFALAADLANYKTKQEAVNDPTANGTALEFISNISQDENGEITPVKKTVDLSEYVKTVDLPVVNDGKFTVSGTGALTGTGFMTANQVGDTEVILDIDNKGVTTDKIADHAVGAHQTKACKDYTGEDAEVWVFYCGTASDLV